jgi:inorganic pyrophosphatase
MNLLTIPALADPGMIHVVVESPRGSTLKLKYEARWEAMTISRPLPLGVIFPYDWGFVPSTCGPDGDAVDAMLLWDVASFPGVVVPCRPLGVLRVEQNRINDNRSKRIRNDRIVAVPEAARRQRQLPGIEAIPVRVKGELEHFAVVATGLEGKDVRPIGWGDAAEALQLIADCSTHSS